MTASTPSEHQLLMAGYILGDLSPEEAVQFEQLLADNPHLQSDLAEMQQVLDLAFVPEVPPPAHLKASILSAHQVIHALASTEPVHSVPASAAQSSAAQSAAMSRVSRVANVRHLNWWLGSLGTVAALVILGLGINNYHLRQSLQALQAEAPTANTLTFALKSTEANVSGLVNVMVNPEDLEGTLQVENLPPLPEGQVYVLWTVVEAGAPVTTDAKNAILTEVFTVDAQGNVSKPIAVPSVFRDRTLVKAVAITVENADAPQRHQSTPILIEKL